MIDFKGALAVVLVMVVGMLLTGCPPKGSGPGGDLEEEAPPPHGGKLFAPIGDVHPFHAELKYEGEAKPIIYLLDKNVKKPVSTPAEKVTLSIEGPPRKTVVFKPDREASDPEGESSRFTTDEAIRDGVDLKKVEITLNYKGKPWTLHLDDH